MSSLQTCLVRAEKGTKVSLRSYPIPNLAIVYDYSCWTTDLDLPDYEPGENGHSSSDGREMVEDLSRPSSGSGHSIIGAVSYDDPSTSSGKATARSSDYRADESIESGTISGARKRPKKKLPRKRISGDTPMYESEQTVTGSGESVHNWHFRNDPRAKGGISSLRSSAPRKNAPSLPESLQFDSERQYPESESLYGEIKPQYSKSEPEYRERPTPVGRPQNQGMLAAPGLSSVAHRVGNVPRRSGPDSDSDDRNGPAPARGSGS